jgi:hypothetical protein
VNSKVGHTEWGATPNTFPHIQKVQHSKSETMIDDRTAPYAALLLRLTLSVP